MSPQNVETLGGVRTPVTVPSGTRRRRVDEWVLLRFPALACLLASAWGRLPPHSRLRRTFLSRLLRQTCEAANRRDFGFLVIALDPEVEYHFDGGPIGGFVPPDLLGVHHGRESYVRMWNVASEAIEDLRLEVHEVIDFGDRLLTAGRQTGHGTSSGIPVSQPIYQLITLQRGLVIRQEDFTERNKALEAAGLSE